MARSITQLWWGWLACALLVAPGTPASAQTAQGRKSKVERIHFIRTGGFAGLQTRIEGSIDFGSDGRAEVTAEKPTYSRVLGEREKDELNSIDVRNLLKLKRKNAPAADQYQYDITVKTTDGKNYAITVDEEPASDLAKLAPGLEKLAEFVRRESERIWQQRSR